MDSLPSILRLGANLSIELLGRGKSFLGLGGISHGDVMLRSGAAQCSLRSAIPSPWNC